MEYAYLVIAVIIIIVLVGAVIDNASKHRKVFKDNVYNYTAKNSVMTRAEAEFFRLLQSAVRERYLVFPQVHLSSLLDHRVKGQEWRYAFRHINGKSVDYVLCDKATLRPAYAIELDDYTHDQKDRQKRDSEVERIFEEAGLPLVRFRDVKTIDEREIIEALVSARKLIDTTE